MIQRNQLSNLELSRALREVDHKLDFRLREKGSGTYAGPHECYGIIAEEFNKELLEALHENDPKKFRKELLDIAVACVIGMASMLPTDTPSEGTPS